MNHMNGYGLHHNVMAFGWIFQLIIFLLFFLVIWWLFRSGRSFGYKAFCNDSALDILKKRLASGDIDSKEYERLKKEILKE